MYACSMDTDNSSSRESRTIKLITLSIPADTHSFMAYKGVQKQSSDISFKLLYPSMVH